MGVTTGLRLAVCGGVLALSIANAVLADEVTIESGSYTLNGDIVVADGQQLGGRVVLLVHGTLAHKDMEQIVLLGHSRGANQLAKYVLQDKRSVQMAILLAPL